MFWSEPIEKADSYEAAVYRACGSRCIMILHYGALTSAIAKHSGDVTRTIQSVNC